jgi:MOSC domain-containing protein
MRTSVGRVGQLWRYPVKSMRGEQVRELIVTERGAVGDRLYAIRELKYGALMSARMFASMLQLRAVCEPADESGAVSSVRIELPDGTAIHAEDANSGQIDY